MTHFTFKVLGANSATPLKGRFPSSFVLEYNHKPILLDCGEGAQVKMTEFNVRTSKMDHIFISHLHGDHIFGLPGFLNSLQLNGRKRNLHLYGPIGIRSFIQNIQKITSGHSSFEIIYHELSDDSIIDMGLVEGLHVQAFPLKHRVRTYGYIFRETQREVNINPEAIREYNLTIDEIKSIKNRQELIRDGVQIPVERLILPKKKERSFAYCTDTVFCESLSVQLHGCDTIYHEATYTHDLVHLAKDRMHSTAHEAAVLAKKSEAGQLIIGHYSSRYSDLSVLQDEAREVFPNTQLAQEGLIFEVSQEQSS